MATLELSPEESSLLEQILASYLSDLRMEIADTDLKDFRDKLKAKEVFIKKLLAQLES